MRVTRGSQRATSRSCANDWLLAIEVQNFDLGTLGPLGKLEITAQILKDIPGLCISLSQTICEALYPNDGTPVDTSTPCGTQFMSSTRSFIFKTHQNTIKRDFYTPEISSLFGFLLTNKHPSNVPFGPFWYHVSFETVPIFFFFLIKRSPHCV